ncbi:MAG TPA: alpha/beta hydrolase [Anaerolineales bacterium]|nr:alpha/beta hydrolase [Anaerolineales bacterium]
MLTVKVNGFSQAYERQGTGLPLVLVHGYPLDHTIWEPVLPLLEKQFDLVVPDLRGFGGSAVSPSVYLLTDLAADLAALLDSLRIEKAAVAGHSMGGYVALAFAHAYPGRTLGLGLVASQALADSPERKSARAREAEHVLANGVGDVAEDMSKKLTANPSLQARLKELILRQPPAALAGALRAMAGRPDSTPFLPEFDFPVALIHGLADGLVPVERARAVQAAVKDGHLTEVPGAGHMPMLEAPSVTAEGLAWLLEKTG